MLRIAWKSLLWAAALVWSTPLLWIGVAEAAGRPIDEVWMRYGGGRPYYDSIMEPRQMDMNGMQRRDPALIKILPPIEPEKKPVRRTTTSKPATPKAVGGSGVGTTQNAKGQPPQGQSTTAKPTAPSASKAVSAPKVSQVNPATGAAPPSMATPPTQATPGRTDAGLPPQSRNGSLARPELKGDVFVPPASTSGASAPQARAATVAPTAAQSGASSTATGNNGGMQGAGNTAGGSVPAGARP